MPSAYLNDLLDECLVSRDGGTLNSGDRRANPCDESKLGALAQLVASLETDKAVHAITLYEAKRNIKRTVRDES